MKISIEEKIERETWEVLKQLKRDILLTPRNRYVNYEVVSGTEDLEYPSPTDQRKIITKLEDLGAFKIHTKNFISPKYSVYDSPMFGEMNGDKPKGYQLDIHEKEFEVMFKIYQEKFADTAPLLETKKPEKLYITKDEDVFRYNGQALVLSDNFPCKAFRVLYNILPRGGEISYKSLGEEIKKSIPEKKNLTDEQMKKFISANLTDQHNGFLYYAKIRGSVHNGHALIEAKRGFGVVFNNEKP